MLNKTSYQKKKKKQAVKSKGTVLAGCCVVCFKNKQIHTHPSNKSSKNHGLSLVSGNEDKTTDIQRKMPSLVGDGSSCSGMHRVRFNGGVTDSPQNGYWARAANFLLPSCLYLPMLSGPAVPIRNCLRAITAGRVKHPSDSEKKSEMNRYF